METEEILRIFEQTGALQKGHFELTSGLHSTTYFQCALVLQHPQYLEQFCREIIDCFYDDQETLDVVVAPAVGGMGHGAKAAPLAVESVAKACGSSAMVLCSAATSIAEPRLVRICSSAWPCCASLCRAVFTAAASWPAAW